MNEEENKGGMGAGGWILTIFFVIFWPLVLGKLPDDLFWPAIVAEVFLILCFIGFVIGLNKEPGETEKIYYITPESRAIEQERVLKAEAERLKARDDAKKAEREKLARLLDEL